MKHFCVWDFFVWEFHARNVLLKFDNSETHFIDKNSEMNFAEC